jgi:enoyl-CoA hydratase/carnithine racemase
MPHPHLAVETSPAGYRWLRLARPERRNALDVSLLRAVTDALAADPGSRSCWPAPIRGCSAPGPT